MYKAPRFHKTDLKINKAVEGETLETKIERIVQNKEPISDTTPMIYTERKDGVNPAYDIRTDKWEIACSAMDVVHKNDIAKSEGTGKIIDMPTDNNEGEAHQTDTTN